MIRAFGAPDMAMGSHCRLSPGHLVGSRLTGIASAIAGPIQTPRAEGVH